VSDADDGFLSRWARRKAQVRDGRAGSVPAEPGPNPPGAGADLPTTGRAPASPVDAAPAAVENAAPAVVEAPARSQPATPAAAPLPTMDDVALLTRESDFSAFVRPGVDSGVKNAALKKLFSDPRYNVMDGLDTYIDDYGKPDPIPPAMLRRMTQSAMLGLFDSEPETAAPADRGNETAAESVNPDGPVPLAMAQSPDPGAAAISPLAAEIRPDDDPDLRLQQDDAAERPGPAPGARC
jgi:hypothetical protein